MWRLVARLASLRAYFSLQVRSVRKKIIEYLMLVFLDDNFVYSTATDDRQQPQKPAGFPGNRIRAHAFTQTVFKILPCMLTRTAAPSRHQNKNRGQKRR